MIGCLVILFYSLEENLYASVVSLVECSTCCLLSLTLNRFDQPITVNLLFIHIFNLFGNKTLFALCQLSGNF